MIAELLLLASQAVAAPPSPEDFVGTVRRDHPRLFINRQDLPAFRQRAKGIAAAEFARLRARVDAYSAEPVLEWRRERFSLVDGKLSFLRKFADQNSASMAVMSDGGVPALECAIVFMVTGERCYRDRAVAFLKLHADFVEWAGRQKIMVDWRHYSRLAAFTAYDWLYDDLSLPERRATGGKMLRSVEALRHPAYIVNYGDAESGNYGETGLRFYAGLATLGDEDNGAVASGLLRDGYRHMLRMMEIREEISGGSGILLNYCTKYTLGDYPWSSLNFLRCLKSAAGIDGTRIWRQMFDFANYFYWAVIPSSVHNAAELGTIPDSGFLDYGWGDTDHARGLLEAPMIYSHLIQILDLYGENPAAVRAIELIPPHLRDFRDGRFPQLPFLVAPLRAELPPGRTALAARFPNCGMTYMRSGTGPDDTYAAFKGGARFSRHHNHYDELSFIIYHKGFQALDSGDRGVTPHHLVYYPQSVAHNTLLIRMPEEPLPPHWYPGPALGDSPIFCDGGQNAKGEARALFAETTDEYVVSAADATRCYSSLKCTEAIRFFVYVAPRWFVIYDRLTSVKPEQEKVFLLHSRDQAVEVQPGTWRTEANGGALFLRQLLPLGGSTQTFGGPGLEFVTNGRNWPCRNYETVFRRPNWLGAQRLEWRAPPGKTTRFLSVLETADREARQMTKTSLLTNAAEDGVELVLPDRRRFRIWFVREGKPGYRIEKVPVSPNL